MPPSPRRSPPRWPACRPSPARYRGSTPDTGTFFAPKPSSRGRRPRPSVSRRSDRSRRSRWTPGPEPVTARAERCGCDHPGKRRYRSSSNVLLLRWDTKPNKRSRPKRHAQRLSVPLRDQRDGRRERGKGGVIHQASRAAATRFVGLVLVAARRAAGSGSAYTTTRDASVVAITERLADPGCQGATARRSNPLNAPSVQGHRPLLPRTVASRSMQPGSAAGRNRLPPEVGDLRQAPTSGRSLVIAGSLVRGCYKGRGLSCRGRGSSTLTGRSSPSRAAARHVGTVAGSWCWPA
jgi:hypothetical protein